MKTTNLDYLAGTLGHPGATKIQTIDFYPRVGWGATVKYADGSVGCIVPGRIHKKFDIDTLNLMASPRDLEDFLNLEFDNRAKNIDLIGKKIRTFVGSEDDKIWITGDCIGVNALEFKLDLGEGDIRYIPHSRERTVIN